MVPRISYWLARSALLELRSRFGERTTHIVTSLPPKGDSVRLRGTIVKLDQLLLVNIAKYIVFCMNRRSYLIKTLVIKRDCVLKGLG